MNKKSLIITGLAALMLLPTSCRENEFGQVDLTMPEEPTDPDVEATYTSITHVLCTQLRISLV